MSGKAEKENLKALTDFLADIDILKPLEKMKKQVNFFDILKIGRMEIRHSNMLAWLFTPYENHGLGGRVLKGFITRAAQKKHEQDSSFDLSRFGQMDFDSFTVYREWCFIDILAVSQSEDFVLCIENKIDSNEHGNQLELYAKRVDQTFCDHQKLFVYLSPDGREPSDTELWLTLDYRDVLNVIENAVSETDIDTEAGLIIDHYIKTVRRDIMGYDEVKDLCAEIYQKHKKAIDLIIENRPNTLLLVRDIVFRWANKKAEDKKIIFDWDNSADRFIRFQTSAMSRLLPDAENVKSEWDTHSYYYYEIVNINGYELSIQLAINSCNIPDDLREMSDKITALRSTSRRIEKWRYRYPMRTASYELPNNLSESGIHRLLDKMLDTVFEFETALIEELDKSNETAEQ